MTDSPGLWLHTQKRKDLRHRLALPCGFWVVTAIQDRTVPTTSPKSVTVCHTVLLSDGSLMVPTVITYPPGAGDWLRMRAVPIGTNRGRAKAWIQGLG